MSLNLRLLERLRRSLSGGRSAPDGAARFQPGARLADRYVIQGVLGAGANGQVFLAHDESLATPVALKALAPALLASESAQQRLKQEVLAARTVSHPNVCRVHDLVELDEDLLVSMAYLEGETLSEHLDRRGLERGDALRILRQIIAGLTAIHDQQVVHGDIKASNVMLSGGQAVITDFGLARPVRPDADGSAFEGTPLYMAPEQISGGPLSPATDVFALGVLIYRMFVGRWPFLDSSPLSTALKRLHSSPEHTAELEQAAGPALAQLVLRCLHPDPAERCSLRDLDQELRQTTAAPAAAPARRARWVWAGGALGLALVAAGVLLRNTGEPAPVSRLVVLTPQPADDQSPAWLGQALGQLLARQLESRFQISAQADVQLASWVGPARPEATWLQDDAGGGQLVLTGKYRKADAAQQIRFTLAAQHGAGVRWQAEFLIAEGAVIDELTARSAELTQNLGETLQLAPRVAAADAGEHLPAAAAGLSRVYAEAQHDLSRFDLQQAARRVSGGLKETPEDALLWHLKSRVEEGRGRPRAARRAAARALELSGDLPRRQQLEIQARQAQLSGQPQEAGRLLEALSTFFPETLSYRLDLARALNAQGELAPALAVLDNLQTLPLSGLEQQLGKLLHAELSIGHGQFDRARGQLPELLNYANTNALLPMQAQLLRLRARQRYYADDNLAGAVDDLSAAGALYQTLGDRRGQADCATALANYARHHGDLDGAETLFAGALKIAETLGDTDLINRTINGRANALSGRGLYREATALYEDVLARVVALGDKHLTALMHHNIGVTALKLGELDHGFEALERSRAMNETAGNPFGMMLVHYGLGNYRWERAEMDQAQTHYEAARDLAARHNSPAWERFSDLQLAQIERWRGATAAATLRAQRSFDGFLAGAQEDRARRAARVLAAILIDHGAPDRARALTRDWADTTNSRELLLLAMLDVAQHPSTAAEQAEAALDAVSDLQHLPERLEVMTGVADVLARAGERAPARELLTQVRGEAQSHGLVRVDRAAERLERRLAESPPVGERVADPTR